MISEFFDTTIGDQVTLQRGFDITKKQQLPGNVPVVSSGGISSYHNEAKVIGPGVVLGRKGSLGTVFYINEDFWPHDTSLWVKDFKGNNPRFVYYFFSSIAEVLKKMDVGAANPALNRNHVHPLPIKWTSRETQDDIVKVLASLDDKIELNRRINQTLEQIAQAIFKSWFVDFEPVKAKIRANEEWRMKNGELKGNNSKLSMQHSQFINRAAMCAISGAVQGCTNAAGGRISMPEGVRAGAAKTEDELDQLPPAHLEQLAAIAALFPDELVDSELGLIPKGWKMTTLGGVSICYDSKRVPLSKRQREQKRGNIPYYGATSVMDYVDDYLFDGIYLLIGEDGSVMRENGTPFVQYIWGESWVNNHAHVLQGKDGMSTEQLMIFIQSQNISAYITGAVQLKLNQRNMNSIPFLKAPSDLNQSFYSLIEPLYAKYRQGSEEIDDLINLRDTLLPKLLSGEIELNKAL